MASHIFSVPIANGDIVTVDDTIGRVTYYGFSLRETAGTTAVVRIRQGTISGVILDDIAFAANEAVADFYGPDGLNCYGDLYGEVVSGTVEGSIRYG